MASSRRPGGTRRRGGARRRAWSLDPDALRSIRRNGLRADVAVLGHRPGRGRGAYLSQCLASVVRKTQLVFPIFFDLHRIVIRGLLNHEPLTDEEMDRLRGILYVTVRDLDNVHHQ